MWKEFKCNKNMKVVVVVVVVVCCSSCSCRMLYVVVVILIYQLFVLQSGVGDGTAELCSDMSIVSGLVSDGTLSLMTDVRAGLNRVTQVFITHSANVFMVDYPPVIHTTAREATGEHLLRLEDQVRLLF